MTPGMYRPENAPCVHSAATVARSSPDGRLDQRRWSGVVTMRCGHSVVLLAFVVSGWTSAAARDAGDDGRSGRRRLRSIPRPVARRERHGHQHRNEPEPVHGHGWHRPVHDSGPSSGVYRVVAELVGFTPQTRQSVVCQLGTEVELKFSAAPRLDPATGRRRCITPAGRSHPRRRSRRSSRSNRSPICRSTAATSFLFPS